MHELAAERWSHPCRSLVVAQKSSAPGKFFRPGGCCQVERFSRFSRLAFKSTVSLKLTVPSFPLSGRLVGDFRPIVRVLARVVGN